MKFAAAAILSFSLLSNPLLAQSAGASRVSRSAASGRSPIKLPEVTLPVFQLYSTSNSSIDSLHLNPGGYWLLVYRDLSSPRGDALLTLLDTMATPPVGNASTASGAAPSTASAVAASASTQAIDPSKLVIVVRNATGAQLSAMQLNHPGLTRAQWLRDEKSMAAHALGITGAPHLVGAHEGARRWQLAGSLDDVAMQTAVRTWLHFNSLPKNTLVVHPMKRPPAAAPAAAKGNS